MERDLLMITAQNTQQFLANFSSSLKLKDWKTASSFFEAKSCFMVNGLELWSKSSAEVSHLLERWMHSSSVEELVDLKVDRVIEIHNSELHVLDLDFVFSDRLTGEIKLPVHGFLKSKKDRTALYYLALDEARLAKRA